MLFTITGYILNILNQRGSNASKYSIRMFLLIPQINRKLWKQFPMPNRNWLTYLMLITTNQVTAIIASIFSGGGTESQQH